MSLHLAAMCAQPDSDWSVYLWVARDSLVVDMLTTMVVYLLFKVNICFSTMVVYLFLGKNLNHNHGCLFENRQGFPMVVY